MIVDTDIFSEIIKGVDQTVAAHAKTYRRSFGRYTVSAVTVMEIVQGYQQKQANRQLQAFLAALPSQEVLSFDEGDGELAGRIAGSKLDLLENDLSGALHRKVSVASRRGVEQSTPSPRREQILDTRRVIYEFKKTVDAEPLKTPNDL